MQTQTANLANVENEHHSDLERDVIAYLIQRGFHIEDESVYHKRMSAAAAKNLAAMWTPTALYERTRPDFMAIHRRYPIAFYVEPKTHKSSQRHDMCIEAYPLYCRMREWLDSRVQTLYVYRNPAEGHLLEAGFWARGVPSPRCIYVPEKWQDFWRDYFTNCFRAVWGQVPIRDFPTTRGSNDPFAVIDERTAQLIPHWKEQIENELAYYESGRAR